MTTISYFKDFQSRMKVLADGKIETWQDLACLLETLKGARSEKETKTAPLRSKSFFGSIRSSVAVLSYSLGPDAVSVELFKAVEALKAALDSREGTDGPLTAHWIAGRMEPGAPHLTSTHNRSFQLVGIEGYERWGDPYYKLFGDRLEITHQAYHSLPSRIHAEALDHAFRLGRYLDQNKVGLLLLGNVACNPGNVALTLALTYIGELSDLPVVCLDYDFYWKDESTEPSCSSRFNINRHLKDVFAIIEQLYPWDCPLWIQAVNTRKDQRLLTDRLGFNPANIIWMPTTVDMELFKPRTAAQRRSIQKKLNRFFDPVDGSPSTISASRYRPAETAFPRPFVLGYKDLLPAVFGEKTLVFLQPTRVTPPRRIELDLDLLVDLLSAPERVRALFRHHERVILLVTGPVSPGCELYFENLCSKIGQMYEKLKPELRNRVQVAFALGDLAFDTALRIMDRPTVSEVYAVSDLVLLPSAVEGRGLPLMEASATGVPFVAAHFTPEAVYGQVTGLGGDPKDRLDVLPFEKEKGKEDQKRLAAIAEICGDKKKRAELTRHNLKVARRRFTKSALVAAWDQVLDLLWEVRQWRPKARELASEAVEEQRSSLNRKIAHRFTHSRHRVYLPGHAPVGNLMTLQGLMEPLGYVKERRDLRSRLYRFAEVLLDHPDVDPVSKRRLLLATGELMCQKDKDLSVVTDHSLAYRRRDRTARLSDPLTEAQLMGAVGYMARSLFQSKLRPMERCIESVWIQAREVWPHLSQAADTWVKRLRLLTSLEPFDLSCGGGSLDSDPDDLTRIIRLMNRPFEIDDAGLFMNEVVYRPRHLIHFLGKAGSAYFELHILGRQLLESWRAISLRTHQDYSVIFVARQDPLADLATTEDIERLLALDEFATLRAQMTRRFRIISSKSTTWGTNLLDASEELLQVFEKVRASDGVATASGQCNADTLDLLALPCFRFGSATEEISAHVMGIEPRSPYFQFVPPGVRPTIGYPVPVQDGPGLSRTLHSSEFRAVTRVEGGTRQTLDLIRVRSESTAAPVSSILAARLSLDAPPQGVACREICGLHGDGKPYTGYVVNADPAAMPSPLRFVLMTARRSGESVDEMARRYEGEKGRQVVMAINGGYVLNELLVSRLKLRPECIGTPLGLMMVDGKVLCPPLYNRPALAMDLNGGLRIARVNLDFPGEIRTENPKSPPIAWRKSQINPASPDKDQVAVYTLLYPRRTIDVRDRVLMVLAGRIVSRIMLPEESIDGEVEMLPVGLHLTIPVDLFLSCFRQYYYEGTRVEYGLAWPPSWRNITDAVEAGPLLLRNGRVAIDMELEGWNSDRSIRTQASRLDLTDLRGPKIAVGLNRQSSVVVLAVNGRIRDSVGATYHDLARILKEQGASSAMGFDPGGSATLVLGGKVRNIPPNNPRYEQHPFRGPSVPRPVMSSVLGTMIM